MVIWSWTSNVVNRGQNVPVGSTPTDTIGPRSRSRLSPRYVLVVLKWRKNRSTFKARRVFSSDFVQSDSFLCQPTDEHNRETFACESNHSRLATIILDVPVAVKSLPVVWIAYKGETFVTTIYFLVLNIVLSKSTIELLSKSALLIAPGFQYVYLYLIAPSGRSPTGLHGRLMLLCHVMSCPHLYTRAGWAGARD